MSESGEEDERAKTPVPDLAVVEDDEKADSESRKQRHRRHHHHHHRKRNGGDRIIQRPRGGCYSTAPDEEKRAKLFAELIAERDALDARRNPHLYRLIQTEISRVAISPEAEHSQEVDLYHDYPITLNVRCFPPTKLQPNFNYAGRIIGPKGAYLRALMQETRAKIVVLGHGVMKDKGKETELLKSGDPKYMHLTEEMHFSVTVDGPAIEAYDRMSNAISCLKQQLLSDSRDLLDLPWIFRVVENGAAPPKGVKFIRHSVQRDRDRGFRERANSPMHLRRRHVLQPQRRQPVRSSRCFDASDARMRQHYPNEKPFIRRRQVRNYVNREREGEGSASSGSERGCTPPPRRRNAPAPPSPTGDNYRDSSGASRKLGNKSRARKSQSPGYAAAEATSSYYSETNSQERDTWMETDGEIRTRDQNNSRSST